MRKNNKYYEITAHSVWGSDFMGRPKIQIRPIEGEIFSEELNIECSKSLSQDYPVGTQFRIRVKLTDMEGTPFLYSYFGWPVEVINYQ